MPPSIKSTLSRILCAAALAGVVQPAFAGTPDAVRQGELIYRLEQDCGSCHGLTLKGGLGPALTPARLAPLSDASLVEAILDGRPGTPMPPWSFEISVDEARWLVGQLKNGIGHDD